MRRLYIAAAALALMAAGAPIAAFGASLPDYTGATAITLGAASTVKGSGATVSGNTVSITEGGNYTVSGTLTGGMINVNTAGKVYIQLSGARITNATGPALMVTNAKRITLTLKDGTTNYMADGASANENDAVIFTNDTLEINGTGALTVEGNNKEGISSDDDIIISGGTIRVASKDDGLNAHDDITFNGGFVYIVAGGDGIDSNGTVNMNGGTVISMGGTTGGTGGLDAEGLFTIKGGTLVATGNSFTNISAASTQSSLLIRSGAIQAAKVLVCIKQGSKEILTFAPARTYQNVLYSSPDLISGAVYSAFFGGTSSGIATDGIFAGGSYNPPSNAAAVAATAAISPAGAGFVGQGTKD